MEPRVASTGPIMISSTFGTESNLLSDTDADLSSLLNSIFPIVDDLIDSPSSYVLSPARYSSEKAIFSPGNLNSSVTTFAHIHNY